MEKLKVTYATIKQVLTTAPSYYVAQGDGGYDLFVIGDLLTISCNIVGTDTSSISDFETHYKSHCISSASHNDALVLGNMANGIPLVAPRSANGRLQSVNTITKYTTNFQLRPFSFQTSTPSSMHNSSPTAAMSDLTMKCYDSDGYNVTNSPSTAVKTVLDFEPAYSYEVIGGWLDVSDNTKTQCAADGYGSWYISAIGVPDIPSAYGGSIPFVYEIDVALIPGGAGRILSDALSTSYLKYTVIGGVNYHTNKLRWIVRHPVGAAQWFQIFVRTYV